MNAQKPLDLAQFEGPGTQVEFSGGAAALLAECKRQREVIESWERSTPRNEFGSFVVKSEWEILLSRSKMQSEQIAELVAAATALRKHLTASELDDVPDAIWLPFTAALAKVKP